MALDFPANPVNGQAYGSYIYNATVGAWQSKEDPATVATVSTVAPVTGNPGDIWYDSDDGTTYIYYDDGNSGQWVELLSSGVPLLNTKADLSGATFTGNVTAPRFISNQATGTAPFGVTSTTVVTNLNADTVDGVHIDNILDMKSGQLSTNTTDFNTITSAGVYKIGGDGTWTGSSNGPTSAYSFGQLVVTANGTVVTQIYYPHGVTGHWIRSKFNASDWQVWQKFYTSSTVVPVEDGGTGASTLTSGAYLKGAGTSAITAQTGIPSTDLTGTIDHARMPSGSLVQTAFVSTSNRVDISSQDPVAITGLSINFTPKFSDSNILLQAMINSNEYYVTSFAFLKNGTSLTTTTPNSNTGSGLFTLYDTDSVSTNMRNAYLLWSDPAGSTTARTYAVGATSSWAGTINTLIINDRSDNVMRSYSTFAIFEVRP